MGTELAQIPTATPQIARSLSPQELQDHRARIAFEVKVHVGSYERDERVLAAQLAWWCDELQDWTQEQVVWALRKWNRDTPDKKPTPGHIVAIMIETRGRRTVAQLPKPQVQATHIPATKEEAAAIAAQYGYGIKLMDSPT